MRNVIKIDRVIVVYLPHILKAVPAYGRGLTCTGDGLNVFKQCVCWRDGATEPLPQPGPT